MTNNPKNQNQQMPAESQPPVDTTKDNQESLSKNPEVAKVEPENQPTQASPRTRQGAFQPMSQSNRSDDTQQSDSEEVVHMPGSEDPNLPRRRVVIDVPGPARTGNGNDRPTTENRVR